MQKTINTTKLYWDITKKYSIRQLLIAIVPIIILIFAIHLKEDYSFINGDVDKYMMQHNYEDVLRYRVVGNIFNNKIVKVERYKGLKEYENLFDKDQTTMDKVTSIIQYINNFNNTEDQNNPQLLGLYGGNCQAKALMARDYMNRARIPNRIECTKDFTHMYNIVEIDNITYKLDLINGIMKPIDKEK